MGREIVYCSQCGVRILEKDLAAGRAFTVLDKVFCAECRDHAFSQQEEAPAPAARAAVGKPAARPAPVKATAPSTAGRPAEGVQPQGPRTVVRRANRTPLYIACGVGMLGMVVLIVVIMSSSGKGDQAKGPEAKSGPGKSGGDARANETPSQRAARRLNELKNFAVPTANPTEVVKKAAEAEKEIVGTPTEEEYRSFRKKWERRIAEGEAGKKIDGLLAQVKSLMAGDPEMKKFDAEVRPLLQQAEELAISDATDRVADVRTARSDAEKPYEEAAEKWYEEKGERVRTWMREGDHKTALQIIASFPAHLKQSRIWRVNMTKLEEDATKGKAAADAKAAGKEVELDWKAHLRIANNEHNLKNYAKAKASYLAAEAKLPPAEKLLDADKRSISWSLLYNLACLFAEESKKQEGAEKTKSVDSAFDYLRKAGEAGVFNWPCGEREHATAKDHWDKDKDLDTIRSDARYAEIIQKYAK